MSRRIRLAKDIAAKAHAGQIRKYTNAPYTVHTTEVARIVERVGGTEDMIIAAHLHDLIEDTTFGRDALHVIFGGVVSRLVNEVTDVSQPWMGTREVRKELDRIHLKHASHDGMTIKLADLISNTTSIVMHDPNFAKTYMKEKALLLNVLHAGNIDLYKEASKIVEDYYSCQ